MIQIGTVQSVEFRPNKNGDTNTVMLQVQISEPDDIQSVELFTQSGQEIIPEVGDKVIIVSLTPSYRIAIAGDDQVIPSMGEGERKIYSTNGGAIAAYINWLSTGILEINGNADFAVLFNSLDTVLQSFVTSVNAALAGKLDGAGTPGSLTLDISSAKSSIVKLS